MSRYRISTGAPATSLFGALLVGLLILALLVQGCTVAPPLPQSVSSQGTLNVIGSTEEEYLRGMVRAFEAETGVKTTYQRRSSGESLESVRQERSSPTYLPTYSVWWGGPIDQYISAASEGLLEPYKPRGSNKIPRQYKDNDSAWTGIYVGALAISVNSRVLRERGLPEPGSWADLAKPVYRGQIVLAHPASSGTAYTFVSTILQLNGKDLEKGFDYLREFNRNVRVYERSGASGATTVGRGEAAVGIAFAHDIVAALENGMLDLKVVFPSDGTGYEVGGMALLKNGPTPQLGRQFMDWALSEKSQEMGPLFTAYQIPTNPDARVASKSVRLSDVKTIDYDFEWAGRIRSEVVERFSKTVAPQPQDLRRPR